MLATAFNILNYARHELKELKWSPPKPQARQAGRRDEVAVIVQSHEHDKVAMPQHSR